ncbi:hypothetical protein Ancab_006575 [Ancistrocladus abbreviatus]
MFSLQVIALSSNKLTRVIPSSIGNCTFLKVLDLENNLLSGHIPHSLGKLRHLQSLHLSSNQFSGELPSSFQNLSSLETLDISNNSFSGNIPPWVGRSFSKQRIISLGMNAFHGKVPCELSNLSSLQILNLANNNLSRRIPACLGDLKAMAKRQTIDHYLFYAKYRGACFVESLVININSLLQKYTKTLPLVTSIIPTSISSMSFLGSLNLSDNILSGKIPFYGHMVTFGASSFAGNPGLCGDPLTAKCPDDYSCKAGPIKEEEAGMDDVHDRWFYLSIASGFAAGVLGPYLILAVRKSWADAYFGIVDKIAHRVLNNQHLGRAARWNQR